jgi:virulence-associated protein VapD
MNIHFQRNSEEKRLAKWVREYMWQQFMLSKEYLSELRCFEYEENINGRQITRILIFNPRLARSQHASLRTHSDLEQHREILLYEGYVDDQGSVYVEDRRTNS